jgi:sphingomyelin phosphodiesterase
MKSNLISIIFLFLSVFQINCVYRGNKLSLIEQFEVEDLANALFKQNGPLLMSLFGLSSTSGGIKCDVCSFVVDVLKNYLLQKNGIEKFYELVKQICHFTKLDDRVCDGAIDHYDDIVVDAFLRRFLNGDFVCTLVKICNDTTEYDTIDDYARRILADKPETKEREVVPKKSEDDYYKVLQVTDIHLDMEYKEGAVANCNLPLCCRTLRDDDLVPVKQIYAGLYGTTAKCDANIETVKAFAAKAKETNPDYIMFTGDNIAHSVWLVTQEEVIRATKMQIEAIQEQFGLDTPIYPAIGNHEKAPVDEFHGEETELLQGLADIFKPYLTEEAYETFRKYGYYSMIVKNNLRIVSINCLLCDSMNFNLLYDYTQTKAMFNWLEKVLADAEKNGEIVHIMNHIPMLSTQHTLQCAWRLKILMDRYQNIIRGFFSGHSHSEYLSMVHEYYNETIPTQVNYICSGLTPYSEYQPSFRIYLVDKAGLYVQDYIQYRMNLIESNEKREPVWFIPYNATDLFNVTSLNDIDSMAKFKISPEYIQHKYTDVPGSEDRGKDEGSRIHEQCNYDHDNMEDVFNCTGYSILSTSYLYYLFNKVSIQWAK